MKDKPIIFSTPMVQAIIEGRKSMTRRVMKPAKRNREGYKQGNGLWIDGYGTEARPNEHIKDYSVSPVWQRKDYYIKDFAPYKPGDILWVRETWCERLGVVDKGLYIYKAHVEPQDEIHQYALDQNKWRPSIFMPREAARLFLRVTNVRVERLQDITEEQAVKEGAKAYGPNNCSGTSARIAFAEIWDRTTRDNSYEWRKNPWVWVIEFEREEVEE